jgi:ornithine decarboxylase
MTERQAGMVTKARLKEAGEGIRHAAVRGGPRQLRKNLAEFKRWLPRVQPYYAVKANSLPEIVRTLYKAGASFDVASMPSSGRCTRTSRTAGEGAAGFHLGQDHLRQPIKARETLEELDPYKPLVTYDNAEEIRKIAEVRAARGDGAADQGAEHGRDGGAVVEVRRGSRARRWT